MAKCSSLEMKVSRLLGNGKADREKALVVLDFFVQAIDVAISTPRPTIGAGLKNPSKPEHLHPVRQKPLKEEENN